jgi:hypothetical protein
MRLSVIILLAMTLSGCTWVIREGGPAKPKQSSMFGLLER